MADPLATLRDIHLPPASDVGSSMLWIILCVILLIIIGAAIYSIRRQQRFQHQALKQLRDLETSYQTLSNAKETATQLAYLLKKTALMRYPRHKVASLHGAAWLSFLNTQAPHLNFNAVAIEITELPYQSDDQPLTYTPQFPLLFKLTRAWIKHRSRRC